MAEKLELRVCVGSSCHIRGGAKTLRALEALIQAAEMSDRIELRADLCLDNCLEAPNVVVDGTVFGNITPERAEQFFKEEVLSRLNGTVTEDR